MTSFLNSLRWNNDPEQITHQIISAAEKRDASRYMDVIAPRPPHPDTLQAPAQPRTKYFVSLSNGDNDTARELIQALRDHDQDVGWHLDIDVSQGVWEEILNRVEQCDIFVFLISERSVQSPYCLAVLRYAARRNRFILPVMLDDPDQFRYALPPELVDIQWTLWDNKPDLMARQIIGAAETRSLTRGRDVSAPRPPYPAKPRTPTLLVDLAQLREMRDAFRRCAIDLSETHDQIRMIAMKLQDGALIGQVGDALADALRGPLAKKIDELRDKSAEMARDLEIVENNIEPPDEGRDMFI